MLTHTLQIQQLRLPIFIGVKPKERSREQLIDIDTCLTYAQPSLGCSTDQLKDTICYSNLVKKIISCTKSMLYHLLEHLAYELHSLLTSIVEKRAKISVKVTKLTPPAPNIFGGVGYQIKTL